MIFDVPRYLIEIKFRKRMQNVKQNSRNFSEIKWNWIKCKSIQMNKITI